MEWTQFNPFNSNSNLTRSSSRPVSLATDAWRPPHLQGSQVLHCLYVPLVFILVPVELYQRQRFKAQPLPARID